MDQLTFKKKLLYNLSDEWLKLLNNYLLDEVVEQIYDVKNLTPPVDKIFQFARETPFDKIKVVILGQDPYPKAGEACGSAFKSLISRPASLLNVYKCLLKHKLIKVIPEDGDLTYWEKQGVLLLNTALTNLIGNTKIPHKKIWLDYTAKLLGDISHLAEDRPLVFMLWGDKAKVYEEYILNGEIYTYSHPSPLSRVNFSDCTHFSDANIYFKKNDVEPIDWNVKEPKTDAEEKFDYAQDVQVAFTDGSCYPNKLCKEARAGYAVCFAMGTFEDVILYGSIDNKKHFASNQRAEGIAIYKVLSFLQKNLQKWNNLIIVSDSEFWINMVEKYMPSWAKEGKNFTEKKNSDLTLPMWDLYFQLTEVHGKNISFRHIPSHDKNGWSKKPKSSYEYFCHVHNDYVDQLAGYARENCEPGEHFKSTVKDLEEQNE